jgi:hypothetical protein
MLTNLDFLQVGKCFPPDDLDTKERLFMCLSNKKLFECGHAEVYRKAFERIERVISNFGNVISYPVVINYQKLISLKVADLLLGEPPNIKCDDKGTIDKIIENTDLINTAYEAAIDVSRYGDGLFIIYEKDGKGIIDVTQPYLWFPVVNEDNIKDITYHVIAWKKCIDINNKKEHQLKVQIHNKGFYEEVLYSLKESGDQTSYKISGELSRETFNTNLNDFAIVQVSNVITSDRITGMDDYTDIDSVICELLIRIAQISRILDKHASPSVTGPMSALEKDAITGEWRLKMGNYFPLQDNTDIPVSYVTWDGQLEAAFKQCEQLINQLAIVSEMGAAIFSYSNDKIGNAPSGTALRRMYINALAKVNRIRMRFDSGLKKAIKLCSQLGGIGINDLSDKSISIQWMDGLPSDPVEESQIINNRVQKPTMSIQRALETFDNMSDKDIENEIGLIDEDEMKNNPLSNMNQPFANNNNIDNNKDNGDGNSNID